jgi:hypothetical protein
MTTIAVLRRRTDSLARRWLRTGPTMLAQLRRPISEVRPQLLLSTIISTIKPSGCCPTSARSPP